MEDGDTVNPTGTPRGEVLHLQLDIHSEIGHIRAKILEEIALAHEGVHHFKDHYRVNNTIQPPIISRVTILHLLQEIAVLARL